MPLAKKGIASALWHDLPLVEHDCCTMHMSDCVQAPYRTVMTVSLANAVNFIVLLS